MDPPFDSVITVTLNPAVDCVYEVENLRLGEHLKGRRLFRTPAGKGVNVARALVLLGHRCIAAGFVGRNELAGFEDFLQARQIQSQLLAVDGQTRENVTLIDPIAHTETHIRDVGFEVSSDDLERMSRKLSLLAKPGVLMVFSGSLPPGLFIRPFFDLIDECTQRGAVVALDAPGEVMARLGGRPLWTVKPNRDELAQLTGRSIASDRELIAVGRDLSRTIETVLVSCGAAGGYLFHRGDAQLGRVDLDPQRVVNTVGCGDCMLAGFIAGRLDGRDVPDAYRYALAVATAAAIASVPGEFDPGTVEALLHDAIVEPVVEG